MTTSSNETRMFLCTANVGTVFEQLDAMMVPFVDELAKKIVEKKAEFVAIHMQEVGGKHYKQTMQSIDTFFKYFLSHKAFQEYDRYLIAVDSDFTDNLTFTSLCNVYLIHNSLGESDVELYNFKEKNFYTFVTKQIYTGNLAGNDFIAKERFQKSFFPDFNWSRKGFMQTKWRLKYRTINLVNLHLFHDASNLVALSQSPSMYCHNRKKALKYTVDRMNETKDYMDSCVLFGDFNFRLDLGPLVDKYTNKTGNSGVSKDAEDSHRVFTDSNENEIFVIGDKKFQWKDSEASLEKEIEHLVKLDKECADSGLDLYECEKKFPPSYPFMEDDVNVNRYMETRCPAWCDRVLFNEDLQRSIQNANDVEYEMVGRKTGMGDHKPIYLSFTFKNDNIISSQMIPEASANTSRSQTQHRTKFVFVNYNLFDLDNDNYHLHDFSNFTNPQSLNLFKHSSIVLPEYKISNEPLSVSKENETSIDLSGLVTSVGELLLHMHRNLSSQIDNVNSNSQGIFCYRLNDQQECQCLAKTLPVHVSNSNISGFFLKTLNANFFKLKHLTEYLDAQIARLTSALAPIDTANTLHFTNTDLTRPMDDSLNTLVILLEVRALLVSTCTLNLFRALSKKTNESKRLSIYYDSLAKEGIKSKKLSRVMSSFN